MVLVHLAQLAIVVIIGRGARQLGHDGFAVSDRDLVVVGMDLVEGEETVPVAAVLDKGGLQARLYAGDLGEIDVTAKLAAGPGFEIEFFNLAGFDDGDAGLLGMSRVDKHCPGHKGSFLGAPVLARRDLSRPVERLAD